MLAEDFPYKWWAIIGLSLLSFTAFLDYTIVSTALPFIQKDLNANVLQLQWVMNIFTMVLCMFMIVSGLAGDMLGRKKVFYFGFIIFAVAAVGAGSASNIQWLIFFRAIQGFAGAIIFTLGVALLPQAFPANEQTRAIGIFSAFNGAGLAVGPFLGGLLISTLSWRWVFWINIPIIVTGIIFCSFSLKPALKNERPVKIDWLGFFLLIIGLGCLIYGIINGEQIGWHLLSNWIIIFIGIMALLLLIVIENYVAHPLLDLTIFTSPGAYLAILLCIIAGLITSVFMFFDPLYLKIMRNQTAFYVGMTLLSVPLVQVFISLFLEKFVGMFGIYRIILSALGIAIFSAILHAFFTPTISIYFVVVALMLMGYTWGIANAGTITAIHQSVPIYKLGSAIGTMFTFWNVSSSIFLASSSILFHWRETLTLNTELQTLSIHLSTLQREQMDLLLSNPEQASSILSQFSGVNAPELSQTFYQSFMSGFHWVAWGSALVMLTAFLLGLASVIKNKSTIKI